MITADKFLIGICIILCFSCAKELEIGLDPPPSKLVVKGTLSPQRGLVVQVFKTLNPFEWRYNDSTEYYVDNAEISIFHNDSLIDQCQFLGDSYYQSQFPERIFSGRIYSIKVDVPGYEPVRVNQIVIPETPTEVKDFQLTPHEDQPSRSTIQNVLTFSVLNKKKYTVFNMRVTYDESPESVLGFYLLRDENVICEDFDMFFSNKCYNDEWIDRKYNFTWHYQNNENSASGYKYPIPLKWIYFHIGIIDPDILDYDATDNGGNQLDQGFTEPILAKGNVEGGLGYVVGENFTTIPYMVP